jgi:membrane-bound serine protease (ClpP class)
MIEVRDAVSPGSQEFIAEAIRVSAGSHAECLLICLNTPGGLMTSMREIVESILNAPLPVVVYVYPSGARAASAGVFITVAADIAAMAPGTNIGAAHPVTGSGENLSGAMETKVLNDTVAFARSLAQKRGRNGNWLEDAVRESASITAEKAYEENVIDLVAEDIPSLLKAIDGWELERNGVRQVLRTRGAELHTIERSWRQSILSTIADPNIAYVLLLIGLAGIYFELSHPGAILPGIVGALSLILAFYAMRSLPVNYAGFLFILLALVCFMLEVKAPAHGLLSLAGVISLVLGSLMLFPSTGGARQLSMAVFLPSVLAVSGFFATLASLAFRAQNRKTITGPEALVGRVGRVKKPLAPEGTVFVSGELWSARADEHIAAGELVRVEGVETLKLKVGRIDAK